MATKKVKRFMEGGGGDYGEGEGEGEGRGLGTGGDPYDHKEDFGENFPEGYGKSLGTGVPEGSNEGSRDSPPNKVGIGYGTGSSSESVVDYGRGHKTTLPGYIYDAEDFKSLKDKQLAQEAKRKLSEPGPYERSSNDRAKGGIIKKYAKGGTVSSASSRADGIAQRGKTRGKMC